MKYRILVRATPRGNRYLPQRKYFWWWITVELTVEDCENKKASEQYNEQKKHEEYILKYRPDSLEAIEIQSGYKTYQEARDVLERHRRRKSLEAMGALVIEE